LLVLITALAACTSPDQETISGLDAYITDARFTGSVLVAREGTILLSKGYGQADRDKKIPNTEQTKFRIASLTKQFTAMAILILQSQGKLNVNDSVCDYVSSCPSAWQTITLHQLLTHMSGIPDYYSSPDWVSYQATPIAPSELIEHFIDKPLDFQPGAMWKYSNSGYEVLGTIIEQVSGTSYESFIKDNILNPLKMKDTGYLEHAGVLAVGYPDAYTTQPDDFEDPSTLFASGGLYTTVNDLYLWDQALFTDKLISKDLLDKMFTPYVSVPDMAGITVFGYGYGWFIGENKNHRMVIHTGRIEGFIALNSVYPDDKVIVIVLSNQRSENVGIGIQLANIVFGDE
jgi:CubicO group peptidase (beta-lactamase class C family)